MRNHFPSDNYSIYTSESEPITHQALNVIAPEVHEKFGVILSNYVVPNPREADLETLELRPIRVAENQKGSKRTLYKYLVVLETKAGPTSFYHTFYFTDDSVWVSEIVDFLTKE